MPRLFVPYFIVDRDRFRLRGANCPLDSLEYSTAIVVPETPEKEGHTFSGWGEVAATVPAGDVTYEGSYTVNTYNVYYYVERSYAYGCVGYGILAMGYCRQNLSPYILRAKPA